MTDNRTWEPLLEELTVKTFSTPNNPSEIYTLYLRSGLEEEALNRLTRQHPYNRSYVFIHVAYHRHFLRSEGISSTRTRHGLGHT